MQCWLAGQLLPQITNTSQILSVFFTHSHWREGKKTNLSLFSSRRQGDFHKACRNPVMGKHLSFDLIIWLLLTNRFKSYWKENVDTSSLTVITWQSKLKKKENTTVINECAVNKLKISADCSGNANVPGSREMFIYLGQTNGGGEMIEQHRTFHLLAGRPC